MHAFATIAALLSFGASTVLSGHVLAPARPAPQAFQQRQTSREQVVRRMTHGMRRVAKRQSEPSGVANRFGAPSSFMVQFSGSGTESDNSYAVMTPYGTDGDTFSISTTTSAGDATVFAMTDAGGLASQDLGFLADVSSSTAAAIFFDTPGNVRDAGYITPTCKVSGGILSCSFQGAEDFSLCPESGTVSLASPVRYLSGLDSSSSLSLQTPFLAVNSEGNLPTNCFPVTLNVVRS